MSWYRRKLIQTLVIDNASFCFYHNVPGSVEYPVYLIFKKLWRLIEISGSSIMRWSIVQGIPTEPRVTESRTRKRLSATGWKCGFLRKIKQRHCVVSSLYHSAKVYIPFIIESKYDIGDTPIWFNPSGKPEGRL